MKVRSALPAAGIQAVALRTVLYKKLVTRGDGFRLAFKGVLPGKRGRRSLTQLGYRAIFALWLTSGEEKWSGQDNAT